MGHEFLSIYSAKAAEYLLAVGYLLLFIPFWRYVQGARRAEAAVAVFAARPAPALEPRPAPARRAAAPSPGAGWFEVPGDVWLHPGHTWARLEQDGTVAIGLDDLAHRLVAAERTEVPAVGAHVSQGDPAIDLCAAGKHVAALCPVDGTVVAVNREARAADPYGRGWLFKVKPSKLAANLRQLYQGSAARKLVDDAASALALRADPAMAAVLQDGGAPVHGLATALAGDGWDALAREVLRS